MDNSDVPFPDSDDIVVGFSCPIEGCGSFIESTARSASYTPNAITGDGIGYVESEIECEHCRTQFTICATATKAGKQVAVKGYPQIEALFADFSFENQYDDFLADYIPVDPYGVYSATVARLKDMQHGLVVGTVVQPTFYKMVCLQHIIALEAYLSDRLLDILTDHKELLVPLVGATAALRDHAPKLIEVAKDPDYVANATKRYLQRFSFHDLASVAQFYKAVLKVDLFVDADHEKEMLQIIKMRHDLVHRSGRDNDGVDTVIEDEHVTTLAEHMMDIVARIEAAHREFVVNKYFDPPLA